MSFRKGFAALLLAIWLSGCSAQPSPTVKFLSPICIKPYKKYEYTICERVRFKIGDTEYFIPADFHTDLASIPRIMWPIISPAHSSIMRAAIVHDWFYRMTCDFDRKQTDDIFYAMLVEDGLNPVLAKAMYLSVRWFGAKYYNEDYCE